MTTIKQLKEFLNQFPEDTEVRVLEKYDLGSYSGWDAKFVPLNIEKWNANVDFTDFTNDKLYPWVTDGKHDHLIGKKYLDFGEE